MPAGRERDRAVRAQRPVAVVVGAGGPFVIGDAPGHGAFLAAGQEEAAGAVEALHGSAGGVGARTGFGEAAGESRAGLAAPGVVHDDMGRVGGRAGGGRREEQAEPGGQGGETGGAFHGQGSAGRGRA